MLGHSHIVEGEVGDQGVLLEQQGKWLACSEAGAIQGCQRRMPTISLVCASQYSPIPPAAPLLVRTNSRRPVSMQDF